MDITYHGGSSFTLKGERTVVINPINEPERDAIALRSDRKRRRKQIIDGPGEYEIGGVMVTSLAAGGPGAKSLIYAVNVDGVNVLHVTAPVHELTDKDISALGRSDILLIDTADLKAAQGIVQDILPRTVIPYGSHAVELCASQGVKNAEPVARFNSNGSASPRAVLLKEHGKRTRKSAA